MLLRGRRLRAAVAGSLMVDDPQRDPLAGARLMRAFLKGPQDFSFSETANPLSQGMWERLGGVPLPSYSMEWVRLLRPVSACVAALPAARLLRPVAWGLDRIAAPLTTRMLGVEPARGVASGADAAEEEIAPAIVELAGDYALAPDWNSETLGWVLANARDKERHGPLTRRIVRGRGGRLLGCSLYFGRPSGIAWVLQILARSGSAGLVVDDLFQHAAQQGCAAVRGRSNPLLLDALLRRKCLLLHRASTMVHSPDPELLQAVRTADALLTGLAGESWTRLIGGEFS
jgi:hypothetical protein